MRISSVCLLLAALSLAACASAPERHGRSAAVETFDAQDSRAWLDAAERWARRIPGAEVPCGLQMELAWAWWQAGDKDKALGWWRSATVGMKDDDRENWLGLAREMNVSVDEVCRYGGEKIMDWSDAERNFRQGDRAGAERILARLAKDGFRGFPTVDIGQAWGKSLRAAGRWQDAFDMRWADADFWPAWERAGSAAPEWTTLVRWMEEGLRSGASSLDARAFDLLLRKGSFDLAWKHRNDMLAQAALKQGHHAWFLEKMRAQGEGLRTWLALHAQAVVCQRPEACRAIAQVVEDALPTQTINREFPWGAYLRYRHDRGESLGLAWPGLRAGLEECLVGEEGIKSAACWLRREVAEPLTPEQAIHVLDVLLAGHPRRRELLVAVCMEDYAEEYPFNRPSSEMGNALRAWVRRELAQPVQGVADGRAVWEGRIHLAARDNDWQEVVKIVAGLPIGLRQEQVGQWTWTLLYHCHNAPTDESWEKLTALLALAPQPGKVNLSPGWIEDGSGGHLTLEEAAWLEQHWLPHVKDTAKRREVVLRMACGLRDEVGLMCATGMGKWVPPPRHPIAANQLLAKEAVAALKAGNEASWLALLANIRLADGGGVAETVKETVRQWCAEGKVKVGTELSDAQWSVRWQVITLALAANCPECALAVDLKYPGVCRPRRYPSDGHPIWRLDSALTEADGPPGCSPASAWRIMADWWERKVAMAAGEPLSAGSVAEGAIRLYLPALQATKNTAYLSEFSNWHPMETALSVPTGKREQVVAELRRLAAAPAPPDADEESMAAAQTHLREAIAVLLALEGDIGPAKALWCEAPVVEADGRATFISQDVPESERLLFILYKRNPAAAKAWMTACAQDGDGGLPSGNWTDEYGREMAWDYLSLAPLLPEGTRPEIRAQVALWCHAQLLQRAQGRR